MVRYLYLYLTLEWSLYFADQIFNYVFIYDDFFASTKGSADKEHLVNNITSF